MLLLPVAILSKEELEDRHPWWKLDWKAELLRQRRKSPPDFIRVAKKKIFLGLFNLFGEREISWSILNTDQWKLGILEFAMGNRTRPFSNSFRLFTLAWKFTFFLVFLRIVPHDRLTEISKKKSPLTPMHLHLENWSRHGGQKGGKGKLFAV